MLVRDADPASDDAAACAAYLRAYVAGSPATFEELPPGAQEFSARIAAAYAWLVAERDGAIAGYAYGSQHRERAAYRWAADVTVYVAAEHHRAGVARALYTNLFERLTALGLWTLCAGVTQPNEASDGLHRGMGFSSVGTFRRIGFKGGAWHDVRWWQLDLRPHEAGAPREPDIGPHGAQ